MATTSPGIEARGLRAGRFIAAFGGVEVSRLWWPPVLRMYALSRLYSSFLLGASLLAMTVLGRHIPSFTESPSWLFLDQIAAPSRLDFFTFSGLWDGEYYRYIAAHGYPAALPRGADGTVSSNPWAFLPLYPYLVAVLSLGNSSAFFIVGTIVSIVFGALATLLLHAIVREASGETAARFASTVFAFGPLSFLLQVAYAESMFFCLVFAAILLLQRRHYWLMIVPLVLAAFTRPGEVSFGLAIALVFVARLRHARWGRDAARFPVRERVALVCAGIVAVVAGVGWIGVAALVTGDPAAYFESELSWRGPYLGDTSFMPFTPWFALAGRYLGAVGIGIVVLIVAAFAWWLSRPSTRRLGAPVLAAVGSYILYLFAVFLPQQSTFRVLMPVAPLLGDDWLVPRPRLRASLVAAAIAIQPLCVWLLWCVGNP